MYPVLHSMGFGSKRGTETDTREFILDEPDTMVRSGTMEHIDTILI